MRKKLIVLQDGYKECGVASLLSIIRYYHGDVSLDYLLELTNTNQEGTSFYSLKKAAFEVGLEAIGYQVSDVNQLREIHHPFICQFISNHYEHFVVVYQIKKDKIILMDPAFGEKKIKMDDFQKLWTGNILIFSPMRKLSMYKEEKIFQKIVIDNFLKNKTIVFDILLLSILFMLFSFFGTLYFEMVIDKLLGTNMKVLIIVTLLFLVLLFLKSITGFIRNKILVYFNQKLDCSILMNTFQKILLLPYSYYKNRTTGEMIARINDLISVKNILNRMILTVYLDFVIVLCFGFVLFIRFSKLFWLFVMIIFLHLVLLYIFKPILKRYIMKNQVYSAQLSSGLVEVIHGFESIKNLHLEKEMNYRLKKDYLHLLNHYYRYERVINYEMLFKDIVSLIDTIIIPFFGFALVMRGTISIGSLLTFVFLTNYIMDSFNHIMDLDKDYFYVVHSFHRANHLFEVDSEDFQKKTHYSLSGNITFQHLSFGYLEQDILKGVTFNIFSGDRVLLLGESGNGKSTLLKLLLKYYSVSRDSIYLDNIDINDISLDNLRNEIACVSQNEFLFCDTIRNNILMNRCICDEEFLDVVKNTGVDSFVKDMFLGYDTMLEENGVNLSGGQRQRIVLARALLSKCKILLLDEAFNALDVDLERKILRNLFLQYKNMTFIVVSHRIDNLDLFTKMIRLENGKVVEESHLPLEGALC